MSSGVTRHQDAAMAVVSAVREQDVVVAALGTNVFELFAASDRPLNYYTWGGMGLAASIGLGLALGRPDLRVVVLDGDGALLMNPNAMFAIARARVENLMHVVCDNQSYSTTGGQPTGSDLISFVDLAAVYKYAWARRAVSAQDVHSSVSDFVNDVAPGPGLLHVPVQVSSVHRKPTPDPLYYKYRFMEAIAKVAKRP